MHRNVKAICDRFAELVTRGDYVALADLHAYPCPFVVEGRTVVIPDRMSFMLASALWSARLKAQGVRGYRCELLAQELPRGHQFRAWLRWSHVMADGTVHEVGEDVVFFARQPDGRLLVEMVEIVERRAGVESLPLAAIG